MTPKSIGGVPIEVHTINEYIYTDLNYLSLLKKEAGYKMLLALSACAPG
jgi:hypothetical protein